MRERPGATRSQTGRAKNGSQPLPSRRLPRQRRQRLAEMLAELPRHCSLGVKTFPDGYQRSWRGYNSPPPRCTTRKQQPLTPAEAERLRERTISERVNSRLKDEFGCRQIWVRGAAKVMAHLMFGVLALTVNQWRKLQV